MKNIFENAYFGKAYKTRNETIAYYGRYDKTEGKHFLMVSDFENDYILCYNDGHVFHFNEEDFVFEHGKNKGKTIFEVKGWNKEEMINFRLDIISEWHEEINEEELDKLAMDASLKFPLLNPKEGKGVTFYKGFKAGYRKAKEK